MRQYPQEECVIIVYNKYFINKMGRYNKSVGMAFLGGRMIAEK